MGTTSPAARPAVLFVCVKNGGKSQRPPASCASRPDDDVTSARTQPGKAVNALSAEVLQDLGVDIRAEEPTALTEENMRSASLVVVLGAEAKVPDVAGVGIERWHTVGPGERDIEGRERMELIRDGIHARVGELSARLREESARQPAAAAATRARPPGGSAGRANR